MGTAGFLPGVCFPEGACELPTKCSSVESTCDRDVQLRLDDDVNSTMSESSSGIGGLDHLVPSKSTEHRTSGERALLGHESDVDSGIVSCQLMDNPTASISSSETNSSRESSSSSHRQKWRPSSDPTQCVRFDEQLHLSEESIRRSCRKLFATLYSHRFSYPCCSDSEGILYKAPLTHRMPASTQAAGTEKSGVSLRRDEPHSRFSAQKTGNHFQEHEFQRHHDTVSQSVGNSTSAYSISGVRNLKENDSNASKTKHEIRPQCWSSESNILNSSLKLTPYTKEKNSGKIKPVLYGTSEMQMSGAVKSRGRNLFGVPNVPFAKEQSSGERDSVHQHMTPVSRERFESRDRTSSFVPSFQPSIQQNSYCSLLSNRTHYGKYPIHKSLSCTVLPASLNLSSSIMLNDKEEPTFQRRTSDPVSASILNVSRDYGEHGLERSSRQTPHQIRKRNSMIRAYARIVPIVSDDSCSQTSTEHALTLKSTPGTSAVLDKRHSSYPMSPNNVSSHSKTSKTVYIPPETSDRESTVGQGRWKRRSITSAQKSSSCKDLHYPKLSEEFKDTSRQQNTRSYVSDRNGDVFYNQSSCSVVSNQKHTGRKDLSNERTGPSTRENAYPHKSLSMNHLKTNGNRKSSNMEYKFLDQSQKNRFNSLPVLDNTARADTKEGKLPISLKKRIHQSDFTLYQNRQSSSSSSTGKSFLDRIQGFTRSAKNAVQKAFSTERIYRPEREERYEAEGQKLKRSPSFIRGLKERMSKKKRREKKKKMVRPPDAQPVEQDRLNTSWEEPVLGSDSVTHVEGQLLQLNPDGSQVIELTKPPSKPYGFFVARGRIRNSRGVFVSRMRDQETEEHLTGLLGIGDEILEIEGLNVRHADILKVNGLMAQRNSLILTVLPYVCRKD